MKTINITFTVTDAEQELLRLGKCDKPHPQRIKMQLLVEAARNLRNMSETVVRAAREPARPNPRVNTKAELAEINRKRRADGLITGGRKLTKAQIKGRARVALRDAGVEPQPEWLDDNNVDNLRKPKVN